jgi:ABC-type multidrug transport system ATPase subunit
LTFGPYRLILQDGQLIKGTEDGTIRIDCLGVTKTVADGKTLLHDLTFSILPREFVCLVGGSGAGKSTLLDAISGVRPATGGEVRYNGSDYYEQLDSYRSAIGYVPQDDIVPAELTVERALYYAAKLRLPDDMAEAEVRARIDEVMDDLGLTERRGVPIKMLSGGQRKRVSIGAELLSKPTLFFLDEPTSGLDPGLEGRMMALLRKLADQGRTIVLITHATQNVDLCDNIAFLAPGGYLAYYGPPKEALNYFRAEKFADIYTQIEREPAKEVWWQRFRGSPQFSAYVGERLAGVNGHGAHPNGMHAAAAARAQSRPPAAKRVSSLRQFGILSRRYLETIVRDRRNVLTLLAQAPLITAMILAVFHSRIFDTRPVIEGGAGSNVDARQLTFLLAMVAVWFGTSNAAREIVKEAAMYARERRINLKLGAYVASKFVVLTGLSLVQNLILLVPFLVTLGAAALLKLPLLYLALIGGSLAGIGMGLVISSQAANPDRASSLVPIILIPQIIFSGIFVNLRENRVLELISHFMATKWTWRALGATTNIDDVPAKALTLTGIPPALAPQVGVTTGTIYPDATGQNLFYVQDIPPDFDQRPVAYLLILSLFIIASVVAVALFQRRKDIVR